MVSKQQHLRQRVVQFYENNITRGKKFTVEHFVAENFSKRTIYSILQSMTVERAIGSGRKPTIMNNSAQKKLKKHFNNKDVMSQTDAARKFQCSQQHISKTLKKLGVKARHKQRSPKYSEEQIQTVKSQCRWMVRNYQGKSFVLDDESYFGLSGSQMPGNNIFYTDNINDTPANVKYKSKEKFEPKVMLYIAISNRGISKPWFKPSGIAVNQEVYQEECLKKILLPFLREHHSNDDYVYFGRIKHHRIMQKRRSPS